MLLLYNTKNKIMNSDPNVNKIRRKPSFQKQLGIQRSLMELQHALLSQLALEENQIKGLTYDGNSTSLDINERKRDVERALRELR